MNKDEEGFYYLALSLVPGLGTTRIHQLVREVGGLPSNLFKLPRSQLSRRALSTEIIAFILGGSAAKAAEKTLAEAKAKGIGVISLADDLYPQLLRTIYDPPVVLYSLGDVRLTQGPAIAIVGARRASVYGRQVTQRLARELAATGLVVVSGLARGIDGHAHAGALEAGGKTVAVMGNGVDIVYPRENRKVYERIGEKGCIISEFPMGTFPAPQNFPIRNRIISGLSYGTVIVEASEFSGSLITARSTLEQNRELWAVPGNITSPGSYGPNYLIKQGARVVIDRQDILEGLPVYVLDQLRLAEPSTDGGQTLKSNLSEAEQSVLGVLPVDDAIPFDVLLTRARLDLPQLNQCLLRLEMQGLIRQLPGRQYCRAE
ncbi:MAG TPA: DNA-processing protein DprA [Acidobacteriota bacterium]|nr:DNA-processing protein DprA [Acidobacteriota bacterium]